MEISERLQQLRKLANYSQEQLPDALGVSRQAISKWESGQSNPDISNVIKLSGIYNVSTDYILIGKEPNSELTENKMETKCKVEKKTYIPISKKALSIIAIIGSTAVITIIFIAALTAIAFFIKRRK
ncbi:helix-turn-helix domain-containing protein [Clostridium tetani]|uniref:XRE family transcriptional regulator n=3 Tax=Clostridium tetani TaxID=1513 RepID=A0ABY0ENJ9_CLOTA|nr:helix-turn-helix transcriptional regulator [Clostridium tetani]KHO39544.1 XRE family transcriptional regulator [Clostridium tetani]RXI55342.1 XRE family transcriptional regulator [Clostridium tetani]RXI68413.1 XRE family transcriptional regulator [Clostridium tetani]